MNKRLNLLDFIRGLTLISMILYHGAWDLQYMFGVNVKGYTSLPGVIWQRSICMTFIILSGFVNYLSADTKKKIKRGIVVSAGGLIVSFVTILFMPENAIHFGILTFIGFAMILFSIIGKYIMTKRNGMAFIVSIVLYNLFSRINYGNLGIGTFSIKVPSLFYRNMFTTFLGFHFDSFMSVDYFPVLPWIFIYAAGFYLAGFVSHYGLQKYMVKPEKTAINFIGKHTLPIYMIHQPVIYVILMMIFK